MGDINDSTGWSLGNIPNWLELDIWAIRWGLSQKFNSSLIGLKVWSSIPGGVVSAHCWEVHY